MQMSTRMVSSSQFPLFNDFELLSHIIMYLYLYLSLSALLYTNISYSIGYGYVAFFGLWT